MAVGRYGECSSQTWELGSLIRKRACHRHRLSNSAKNTRSFRQPRAKIIAGTNGCEIVVRNEPKVTSNVTRSYQDSTGVSPDSRLR